MICDEEVFPLALQNHLLHAKHLTTLDAEWMPQYLYKELANSKPVSHKNNNSRAGMRWELGFNFWVHGA